MKISDLKNDLHKLADKEKAIFLQRFFKTGKGEYAEGDILIGVTVPNSRKIAKKYFNISLDDTIKLLHSKIHEERLVALFILCEKFKKGNEAEKKNIYKLYLTNTKFINNWDLVDSSAYKIVGEYLLNRDRSILYKLVKSKLLWDRRIAVIATLAFIKNGQLIDTFLLSELLLNDKEDLMHKACGWMMREAGKFDITLVEEFIIKNYFQMPRTMLRYAIEKFPEEKRKSFLLGKF